MIARKQWGARPPVEPARTVTPVEWALHWEGTHMGDFDHDTCPAKLRQIQTFHIETRGWTDIAYNFVACPHGFMFEGRGWDRRSAANGTNTGNARALAVCYLSGERDPFTARAQAALNALFAERPDWPVFPHSHYFNTACPGDEIRSWISHRSPQEDDMTPELEARLKAIEDKVTEAVMYAAAAEKHGTEILSNLKAYTNEVKAEITADVLDARDKLAAQTRRLAGHLKVPVSADGGKDGGV